MCRFFTQDKNTVHTTNFSTPATEDVFDERFITRALWPLDFHI
jgi:hypothetical protein